ncbi:ABC transporter permease, partial [candidate division KSB1 bacterium]|nr:ABC transporter permease [candidate division KSB1 bacterium]
MNQKNHNPPAFLEGLLRRVLPRHDRDSLTGDFAEIYTSYVSEYGHSRALSWYLWQVLKSIPKFISFNVFSRVEMFKNYSRVAFRNSIKNKLYTTINIFGLSTGIACCILVYFFIQYELSFDKFHNNADSVYFVGNKSIRKGFVYHFATPLPLAETLVNDFPEVISSLKTRIFRSVVRFEEKIFEEKIFTTDSNFFTFFNFPMTYGNPESVLETPNAIVLSQKTAEKYFGNANPIGKVLSMAIQGEFTDYTVTGVVEIPGNSSLQFDFVKNFRRVELFNDWGLPYFRTVIRLSSKDKEHELTDKLPEFYIRYFGTDELQLYDSIELELSAMVDHHLNSGARFFGQSSNILYSFILLGIAISVLILACVNFMNLSMGSFLTRFKEIGIRKVMGADRRQLVQQFLYESFLHSAAGLLFAMVLVYAFLPAFNQISGKDMQLDISNNWMFVFFVIGMTGIVGFVAGSYPAFRFSSLKPADILRKRLVFSGKNVLTRALIVFQFSVSIFLISATLIMKDQHDFMINTDLGYDKENVIIVPIQGLWTNPEQTAAIARSIKSELLKNRSIIAISASSGDLTRGMGRFGQQLKDGLFSFFNIYRVDYDYLKTFDIALIEGRNFSPEYPVDVENSVIVNETFVKQYNVENPIGMFIKDIFLANFDELMVGMFDRWDGISIIGVIKDFHQTRMHYPIEPVILDMKEEWLIRFVNIKISGNNMQETLAWIEQSFHTFAPDQPFTYSFLDDDIAQQYAEEERWNSIIKYSSFLAILISCSGIFGMALLTVTRRTKDIGIRKVLGASCLNIVKM